MNEVNKIVENFEIALENIREAKKRYIAYFESQLSASTQDIFSLFPDVKSISLCFYTPYFNDGDPCEFTVGDVYFSRRDNPSARQDEEIWNEETEEYEDFTEEDFPEDVEKVEKAFRKFVKENSHVLESVYGTNTHIVITRNGVKTEDYNPGY